jgi:acetylornithine deacetylase
MWFRVAIVGKSWHALDAWRGVNAISKAVPIIQALEALGERMNERVHPAFAHVTHPINLNIGVIRGGDWPSTVPGACELHCRVSFFPGQTVAETRAAIEGAIHQAAQGDDWLRAHPPVISYDGFQSSGSVVSMEEPSVQTLASNHQRIFGAPMPDRVQTSICDMRYYNFVGIPAGCYGAVGANGHAADEWLDLNSLVPTAKVLAGFVLDWCGVVEE